MGLFNRQDSDPDGKHCGHPDQRTYVHVDVTKNRKTGKLTEHEKLIAYCPSCGWEWSE